MYNHTLKVHGENLAKDMTLPANTSAVGNGIVMNFAGALGSQEVVVEVAEDVALADTKSLTVLLEHRDKGGTFELLGEVCSLTAAGAQGYKAGTVLGRFIPPSDCKVETRAVVTTDDAAVSGKIDIYPHYLAR